MSAELEQQDETVEVAPEAGLGLLGGLAGFADVGQPEPVVVESEGEP